MGLFDWPVTEKKKHLHYGHSQNRRLCHVSVWSSNLGYKGKISAKGYWKKVWCYWEHIENLKKVKNIMNNHWEHGGNRLKTKLNTLGTQKSKESHYLKGKKIGSLGCMLPRLICCQEFGSLPFLA